MGATDNDTLDPILDASVSSCSSRHGSIDSLSRSTGPMVSTLRSLQSFQDISEHLPHKLTDISEGSGSGSPAESQVSRLSPTLAAPPITESFAMPLQNCII